jgi:hypothetical protein
MYHQPANLSTLVATYNSTVPPLAASAVFAKGQTPVWVPTYGLNPERRLVGPEASYYVFEWILCNFGKPKPTDQAKTDMLELLVLDDRRLQQFFNRARMFIRTCSSPQEARDVLAQKLEEMTAVRSHIFRNALQQAYGGAPNEDEEPLWYSNEIGPLSVRLIADTARSWATEGLADGEHLAPAKRPESPTSDSGSDTDNAEPKIAYPEVEIDDVFESDDSTRWMICLDYENLSKRCDLWNRGGPSILPDMRGLQDDLTLSMVQAEWLSRETKRRRMGAEGHSFVRTDLGGSTLGLHGVSSDDSLSEED